MMMYRFRNSPFFRHLLSIIATSITVTVIVAGMHFYHDQYTSMLNVIGFVGCFIILPVALLILSWKYRPFRWYFLAVLVIIIPISAFQYYLSSEIIDRDLSNYLVGDTQFDVVAADFLPSTGEVLETKHTEYMHEKIKTMAGEEVEYIFLSLQYDEPLYMQVVENLQRVSTTSVNTQELPYYCEMQGNFMLNGHNYTCCLILHETGYYAIAYAMNADSCCVNIYFISDPWLSSVSVEDELKRVIQ